MNTSSENLITDRRIGERKRTNVFAVFFCIGLVLILFAFIGYAASNGNIYRTINGVDDCGNICGMKNDNNSIDFCGPTDKRNEKFQLWNITDIPDNTSIPVTTPRPSNWTTEPPSEDDFFISNGTKHQEVHLMCVAKCEDFPGFKAIGNRCFQRQNQTDPKTFAFFLQALSQDKENVWLLVLICCAVALASSYVILFLFRYAIKYVIWIIFIGIIALLITACVFCFARSAKTLATVPGDKKTSEDAKFWLQISGACGVTAIIITFYLCCCRKQIALVIEIFKEASKAIGDVPLIVIKPVVTSISLVVTFILYLLFTVVIMSAGHLTVHKDEDGEFLKASYDPDAIMITAYAVNFLALIWFVQFVTGCQHFIIGSTISDWYFANNKNKLGSPIQRAFGNLLNFHLGSVCLGSLLMMAISFVRGIVNNCRKSMKKSNNIATRIAAEACDCGLGILDEILQYLVHTAYIIVAKDGTPLYSSGKRAFHLLKNSPVDVFSFYKIDDLVLALARLIVVSITGFVAYVIIVKNDDIEKVWLPITMVSIFAYLIIHCFMTVFEVTLKTIFICFCEDIEQNNGIDRPYVMSSEMMEVMQKLKQKAGGQYNFYKQPFVIAMQSVETVQEKWKA